MFDIWPRSGPFSLCPTEPASLALVRDLIVQQARCVKGELFNINCDEVYDIAYGRSKLEVERRGRVAVFTEFLRQVAASVREAGKRPMFWADVILTHADKPEHAAELASLREFEMTALVWGYEPDTPFESHVRRVHEAGLEAWVCPGTSSWRAITGRTREREANIAAAIDAAARVEANEIIPALSIAGRPGGDCADGLGSHTVVMFLVGLNVVAEFHTTMCIEVQLPV